MPVIQAYLWCIIVFQYLRQQSDLLQHGLFIRPFQVPTLFVVQRSHTTMVFDVAATFYTIWLQSADHGVPEGVSIDTSLNHSKSSLVNAWLVTGATVELNALHWDVGFNLAYFLPGIDDTVPLSFRSTSSRLFNYSLNVFITTIVSSKGTKLIYHDSPFSTLEGTIALHRPIGGETNAVFLRIS